MLPIRSSETCIGKFRVKLWSDDDAMAARSACALPGMLLLLICKCRMTACSHGPCKAQGVQGCALMRADHVLGRV